jgi:hypothetical protein
LKKLLLFAVIAVSAQSAMANTYVKNFWTHNELSTCFAKAEVENRFAGEYKIIVRDWSDKDKANVQKWANEEYTEERTGIHFTGWQNCEETPNADVILFYNKNSVIKTSIFGGLNGLASNLGPTAGIVIGYPAARSSVSISKSGMKKGIVLHELGHVAGLAHEHVHPGATKAAGCNLTMPTTTPTYIYEPYDSQSIMNYCSLALNKLSDKDVELLKRLYP